MKVSVYARVALLYSCLLGSTTGLAQAPADLNSSDATESAQAEMDSATADAEAALSDVRRDTEGRLKAEAEQQVEAATSDLKGKVLDSLSALESDLFTFGIFPNSAGFMDARLHLRRRYLRNFSSGIYLDYTTARSTTEQGTERRIDRLIKEYRAEVDVLKGLWVVTAPKDGRGFAWSLEPGVNGKAVFQDINQSGFTSNSFGETLFQTTTTRYLSLMSSARLESSVAIVTQSTAVSKVTFDLSGEWLPFIYSTQKDSTVTSQFDSPVKSNITNRTDGFQAATVFRVETGRVGRFTLRGGIYRNEGKVSASSRFAAGNFEYRFDTFSNAKREDIWGELTHSLSYLKILGGLVPAVGVAWQRKIIQTADDKLEANVYKLALLLENQ